MHVEIGRQRVSNEAEWLRGRIGKEEPPCPRLLLAEVQTDPCEGDFPDADWTGIASECSVIRSRSPQGALKMTTSACSDRPGVARGGIRIYGLGPSYAHSLRDHREDLMHPMWRASCM